MYFVDRVQWTFKLSRAAVNSPMTSSDRLEK
jgi:hypothetical protein